MVVRRMVEVRARGESRSMIETTHLSKRYGKTVAVEDVSFYAPPGTVTGFLGPNGAGKSTTLRMIAGLTRPRGHGVRPRLP
jgi:ABC-2 type transport system ATP-binding protein